MAFSSLDGGAFLCPAGQRNDATRERQVVLDAALPHQPMLPSHGRARSRWGGLRCSASGPAWRGWRGMGEPGQRHRSPGLPTSLCLVLAVTRHGDVLMQLLRLGITGLNHGRDCQPKTLCWLPVGVCRSQGDNPALGLFSF